MEERKDVWFGGKSNSDVTVLLVPGSGAAGLLTGRKRRRVVTEPSSPSSSGMDQARRDDVVCAIHVHSKRLRGTSEYFEACLSERWGKEGKHAVPVEHILELQTDVEYYEDCFSRLYSLFKEIPGVKHSIELSKVASQIQYKEVLEQCVCYMSSVSLSEEEEDMIREFASSEYFPSACAGDLSARLGLNWQGSEEEKFKVAYELTQDVLSTYFKNALRSAVDDGDFYETTACEFFKEAFLNVMHGPCYVLKEYAVSLVISEGKRHVENLREERELESVLIPKEDLHALDWLLEILLEARAARELVMCIAEDVGLAKYVEGYYLDLNRQEFFNVVVPSCQQVWSRRIFAILKEIENGNLLLKTSERVTFFKLWSWALAYAGMGSEPIISDSDTLDRATFVANAFVKTLPLDQQKEIFQIWAENKTSGAPQVVERLDLTEAHTAWIKKLQKNVAALEPQGPSHSTLPEINDKADPCNASNTG